MKQAWRDEHFPIGGRAGCHDGRHHTVEGVVIDNRGVMIRLRLDDDREIIKYDHDLWELDPENEPQLRCFGSRCTYVADSETEATSHEANRHEGAQTVFLVRTRADGLGWEKVG